MQCNVNSDMSRIQISHQTRIKQRILSTHKIYPKSIYRIVFIFYEFIHKINIKLITRKFKIFQHVISSIDE